MTLQTNRREFLQTSAVAGVGFYVAGGVEAADETKPKNKLERLNIAAVGVGGKGSSDCDQAANYGNLVAICDIDENSRDRKAEKFPEAAKFFDFREMLEKMGKGIDAVVVSTPDHTHAVASIMAMKAGKHVYCQKPLCHNVAEARLMRKVATDNKVCTQMGNQGTAGDAFRTSVELVQSGALGKIKEVHLWTNRPIWPQAPKVTKRPEPRPVPAHVKWDLFLGPAPERPYAPGYHSFAWRGWRDFGTGALGDMACHTANMPYMGLKLGLPLAISGETDPYNPETFPGWAKVTFEFALPGTTEPIKVTWYEGQRDGKKLTPDLALLQGTEKGYSGSGSLIVAENATLYSPDDYGATRRLIGQGAKDIKNPAPSLPRRKSNNNDDQQKAEWVEAIVKNDPKIAMANFSYGAMLTESILLGNVAMVVGGNKRLVYDAENSKFTGASEYDKLLSREYRTGWKL
ncbi:MAG: gfo/Idh/MocA family oxidoreductase [Planctomycetia bacterium]|nr:gfo/Idh/MocA family oxidoreductase [Planctomycetia bacterium]